MTAYLLLFASAFLAATILPFSSEVVLFSLLRDGGDPVALVVVATLGNTLSASGHCCSHGYRSAAMHLR
jgi:membrane protein YqaA with SNARE-associated domain